MKKILILITLVFSLPTFACLESNLYDNNKKLNSIPITKQGDMNTCYAHSIAQLYNIQVAQNQEQFVSPFWIAFIHKNRLVHWSPKNMDFSIAAWAYKDLRKYGTCNFSIIEDKMHELKRGVPYNHDQFFYMLKHYFKVKFWVGVRSNKRLEYVVEKLFKKLKRKSKKFDYPWFKEDLYTILTPLRAQTSRKRFFNYLKKYVFKNCLDQRRPVRERLVSYGMKNESNDYLEKRTTDYLASGKPVYIGHCPDVVYDVDPRGTKDIKVKPRLLKAISGKCGAHYAVLVGSRKSNQNKCQFLLRNTYGKGFWADGYYSCFCENSAGKRADCSKKQVEKNSDLTVLGCWIDSDKLLSNTYELGTFRL
jgi:hypothetical protein